MYTLSRTASNSDNPAQHDIICRRYNQLVRKFVFKRKDGTPVDITGWDFRMDVARGKGQKPVFQFRLGNGFSISDTNLLTLNLTTMAMAIGNGTFLYDMIRGIGSEYRAIFEGEFIINLNVTPPADA